MKSLKQTPSIVAAVSILIGLAGGADAASSYTFPAFDAGTLTGGGPAFTNSLNVTNVPGGEYLFVRITADYQSDAYPNNAFPSTMDMELSDGGTNVYWPFSAAMIGAVDQGSTNTLIWYGLLPENSYEGGSNLTIQFLDTYGAGGPYYSTISNVVITIYPAPAPALTFPAFDVGTLTGGGSAFTNALGASGSPGTQYLFARVAADYQSAPYPNDAIPSTMEMELTDGGTNVYWPSSTATIGAAGQDSTNVLSWAGLFPESSFLNGTNLVVQFDDPYTDASGPYYSTMSNVMVALYPATAPSQTFPAFDVGTLTNGVPFTNSLDVSTVSPEEYLFVRVTANYQSGSATNINDGQPIYMTMELSDGSTNVYWPASIANVGAVAQNSTNTLAWCGMFPETSYQGGSNLTVQFMDTAAGGTYYSTISNVVVTLYPAISSLVAPPPLTISRSGGNVILTWPAADTGFNLQYATNLVSPVVWNTITSPAPVVINGQNTVTNAISASPTFYRLSQ